MARMIMEIIKTHLHPLDDYVFGTADLTGLIDRKFGEYRFGISIGRRLDDRIVEAIASGPTIEYYHHYVQVNKELAETAERIKNELGKMGTLAIVIEPTVSTGSKEFEGRFQSLSADISHKMVATRAGLGWIGKADLLVSERFGPRLRLVSLLVNHRPKNTGIPIEESRCGKCSICVDECPARAATGELWNTGIHRDIFFNAHKCREKCGELAKQKLNLDIRICGICISVCPMGKKGYKEAIHSGS